MKVFITGDTYYASDVHDAFYARHVVLSNKYVYCIIESKIMKFSFWVLRGTEGEDLLTVPSDVFLDVISKNIIIQVSEEDNNIIMVLPITDYPIVYNINDVIITDDDYRTSMIRLAGHLVKKYF